MFGVGEFEVAGQESEARGQGSGVRDSCRMFGVGVMCLVVLCIGDLVLCVGHGCWGWEF